MKGFMGLQNLMMGAQNVKTQAGGKGLGGLVNSTDGQAISFQKFLQQQQGQGIKVGQGEKALSKEEVNLLKNSFVFLTDLNIKLGTEIEIPGGPQTPFNKKLKKLLEEMGQDLEFVALLPTDLQQNLRDYLQQMNGSFDPKAIEALVGQWNQHQKAKATPVMNEVGDLLQAIKTRLNQAGVNVDVQEEGKDAKVVFSEGKEGKMQVVAKSLLNRISKFLNKTDDVAEKIALKTETLELREGLRKYLHRDQNPVSWRKEEIIHNAQNTTLRRLEMEQEEGAKQQVTPLTIEKLVKEEAKGIELLQPTSEKEEENAASVKKIDQTLGTILNSEPEQQVRMTREGERGQRFMRLQPEEVFAQVVEKFRLQMKDGGSQMEIQLHPEELGRMRLSLSIEDGVVTARLLAGNVHVKELIEQNLSQLKDTFAKSGLEWDEITVDVSQDDLGGNAFASHGQENDQQRGQSRRRRNLDDFMDDDFELGEVAAMGEEDEKDPDRLVDYMA